MSLKQQFFLVSGGLGAVGITIAITMAMGLPPAAIVGGTVATLTGVSISAFDIVKKWNSEKADERMSRDKEEHTPGPG